MTKSDLIFFSDFHNIFDMRSSCRPKLKAHT